MNTNYEMRHFREINIGWKHKGRLAPAQNFNDLKECEYLKMFIKKLGWYDE